MTLGTPGPSNLEWRPSRSPDGMPGGRLLLPCFFSLRAQLLAAALATASRAHRVPSVALHADHLVQPAALGLREAGHHAANRPGLMKASPLRPDRRARAPSRFGLPDGGTRPPHSDRFSRT